MGIFHTNLPFVAVITDFIDLFEDSLHIEAGMIMYSIEFGLEIVLLIILNLECQPVQIFL